MSKVGWRHTASPPEPAKQTFEGSITIGKRNPVSSNEWSWVLTITEFSLPLVINAANKKHLSEWASNLLWHVLLSTC